MSKRRVEPDALGPVIRGGRPREVNPPPAGVVSAGNPGDPPPRPCGSTSEKPEPRVSVVKEPAADAESVTRSPDLEAALSTKLGSQPREVTPPPGNMVSVGNAGGPPPTPRSKKRAAEHDLERVAETRIVNGRDPSAPFVRPRGTEHLQTEHEQRSEGLKAKLALMHKNRGATRQMRANSARGGTTGAVDLVFKIFAGGMVAVLDIEKVRFNQGKMRLMVRAVAIAML